LISGLSLLPGVTVKTSRFNLSTVSYKKNELVTYHVNGKVETKGKSTIYSDERSRLKMSAPGPAVGLTRH
jgi:hypothetical protein